jgi:hypothetical protein
MTNRRFVTCIVSIPVVAGLLLALVADASAAEAPRYQVRGDCVKIFTQETAKNGSTFLRVQTRCEYTPMQRARLAREGK